MDKLILPFICNGQSLKKAASAPFEGIRTGSKNYIYVSCTFNTPPEKAYAVFLQNGKKESAIQLDEDGICKVPNDFVNDSFRVYICWINDTVTVITKPVRVCIKGGN